MSGCGRPTRRSRPPAAATTRCSAWAASTTRSIATRYIGMGARLVLGANDHALLLNAATQRAEFLRAIALETT